MVHYSITKQQRLVATSVDSTLGTDRTLVDFPLGKLLVVAAK